MSYKLFIYVPNIFSAVVGVLSLAIRFNRFAFDEDINYGR